MSATSSDHPNGAAPLPATEQAPRPAPDKCHLCHAVLNTAMVRVRLRVPFASTTPNSPVVVVVHDYELVDEPDGGVPGLLRLLEKQPAVQIVAD